MNHLNGIHSNDIKITALKIIFYKNCFNDILYDEGHPFYVFLFFIYLFLFVVAEMTWIILTLTGCRLCRYVSSVVLFSDAKSEITQWNAFIIMLYQQRQRETHFIYGWILSSNLFFIGLAWELIIVQTALYNSLVSV